MSEQRVYQNLYKYVLNACDDETEKWFRKIVGDEHKTITGFELEADSQLGIPDRTVWSIRFYEHDMSVTVTSMDGFMCLFYERKTPKGNVIVETKVCPKDTLNRIGNVLVDNFDY